MIRHVPQPSGSKVCGQACIAMVLGISLDDAVKLVGHARATRTKEISAALGQLGPLVRLSRKHSLPDRCIMKVRIPNQSNWHWVLKDGSMVFDPSRGHAMSWVSWAETVKGCTVSSFLEVV